MATLFGKELRKLRIDKDLLLGQMAQSIGISSAYLSSVENGKKNITEELLEKIRVFFSLNSVEYDSLRKAAKDSPVSVKIDLKNFDGEDRELLGAFARKIADFSENGKSDLRDIINREGGVDEE